MASLSAHRPIRHYSDIFEIIILTQDSKAPVWSLPDMNFSPDHHFFYYWSGKLIPLVMFNCQYVNGKKSFALEASADADNAPAS
jgi:hypothetical protein